MAERLERHQASDQTVYQHLADGRRLQIIERKTENGGRVGLRVDVTDYIQSQERAERAERRLVDAIAALPAGFWLFDRDDQLILLNDRFKDMYGNGSGALTPGQTYEEILRAGLESGLYRNCQPASVSGRSN